MGKAVRFATAGVALAVALATSACGGAGAAAPVAGAVGATSGATSAPTTAPTSDDVPLPDDTTTTDNPMLSPPSPSVHEGELRNALLPLSAFGSGMKYESDSPHNGQFGMNLPDDSRMTCDSLITGGPDSSSMAYAYAGIDNTNPSGPGFYEAARQYSHLGAAEVLSEIETKAHSLCGSFDGKADNGSPEKIDITVTAKSGVGDAADLVEQVTTFPNQPSYQPVVFESLVAQYGDLLVTVDCVGNRPDVKNCDLVTKAKTIAGKLISQ